MLSLDITKPLGLIDVLITCPCCKQPTSYIHDYRMQKIKDLSLGSNFSYLLLRKRRYVYSDAGKGLAIGQLLYLILLNFLIPTVSLKVSTSRLKSLKEMPL
jgi:hypothetical protein